jgi:nifR3 family TIM-barrel protein
MCVRAVGGLGLATTDLVNARAILQGSKKSLELLATCPDDRPLSVQIFGGDAPTMADAARWLEDYGATVVDINMGCPVRKVVRNGGGSALMCQATSAVNLVRSVVEAVAVPVTVKMRLGWDHRDLAAPELSAAFEQVGVAGVTIHGRTREQGFSGSVDRTGIRAVVEAVRRMPVFGNGDVRTLADAAAMLEETGCAGIAIGRGALANPWIFRQLEAWERTGDPGSAGGWDDRLDLMADHFRRLCAWRGEHFGCLQFRKVATWYCRALRTGREIQQTLVMLDVPATLERLVEQLREQGPPEGWRPPGVAETAIAVPAGPIAHW